MLVRAWGEHVMEILTAPFEEVLCRAEIPAGEVREQLARMLGSHLFCQSRRYAPLLRFIVEESLQGRGEVLKERLLGIHVFHREPAYDTAADPIVRVTIAEIRRRIAQYYHDEAHEHELRIELPAGHYVAEFRPGRATRISDEIELTFAQKPQPLGTVATSDPEQDAARSLLPLTTSTTAAPDAHEEPGQRRSWGRITGVVFLLVCAACGGAGAVLLLRSRSAVQDAFWSAWLPPGKPILLCLPTDVGRHQGALTQAAAYLSGADQPKPRPSPPSTKLTFLEHETAGENVVFSDAVAGMRIVDALARHKQDFHVRLNNSITLDDLRQGPAVLIGGLDNQWSLQAIAPLRYRFAGRDEGGYWISDAQDPNSRRWFLNLKQEYASVTRDYALIAFVHSAEAGQPQLVIAGIGMSGTMAAGEFVSDPSQMERLRNRLGSVFNERDFEVVLGTDVVHGISGPPKVLATWVR